MTPIVTKIAATAAATGAAVAARKLVEFGWRELRHEEPPTMRDSVGGDTQLRDLMVWTALVAAAVLVAKRLAGGAAVKALGDG